jgi:hypothetical protein
MTLNQAIKVLKHHQKWRKGADIKPTEPRELTEALEIAINKLETIKP